MEERADPEDALPGRQVASQHGGAGAQSEGSRPQGGQAAGAAHRSDQARPQGGVPSSRSGALGGGTPRRRRSRRRLRRHQGAVRHQLRVERRDRIVVIGRNGAGKSSLLRCLSGVQVPTAGTVEIGYQVAVGYFAQEHEQIDPDRTVLENIDDTVLAKDPERRKLLGSFGLTGATADQTPASLSGGERARLSLAMLAAGRANLLVLDEPTNNLDPDSVEAVGTMLSQWSGTIVAVSHDRPFVEALAPTHALHLPEERYSFWREEYLDEVELR